MEGSKMLKFGEHAGKESCDVIFTVARIITLLCSKSLAKSFVSYRREASIYGTMRCPGLRLSKYILHAVSKATGMSRAPLLPQAGFV